jgi:hypothetical protein
MATEVVAPTVAAAGDAEAAAEGGSAGFVMPDKALLKRVLLDLSRPIAQRMRSIFYLRSIGGDDAVETLCAGEGAPWEAC